MFWRLCLILLLWLAPVPAQEEDPNAVFVTEVMRRVLSQDGPGAAKLIQADKPRAREAFQVLVVGYPNLTEPKQQALARMYVNTVAQVFAADGDDTLLRQLQAENLLATPVKE